ncbi:MAG: DNA polymerase IV [Planctomycetes bacterium]|nr:DNA polymerase IV [Planctomycetota bacterium]
MIMHIDMNAFFASVEQQVNPMLRGKPIAVVGSGKRTVVTTASYEARAYGVKTGMTMGEAKRFCPGIIFVQANNQRYVDTCTRLVELYKQYTPLVEVHSVDEAFLDVTNTAHLFSGPVNIASEIKHQIKETLGLTCSIGIAPNKLLAKLASDMQKPDGLVVIRNYEEAGTILEDLPVGDLVGIGKRMEKYLGEMGINSCEELARARIKILKDRFGVVGERLHFMALGIDDSPVIPLEQEPDAKSVGHSMTLERDINDLETIERYILLLSEMVGRRLRSGHYLGRTVALTLRYSDFFTFSRRKTIKEYLNDGLEICQLAGSILRSFRLKQAVRLVGVSVSNLAKIEQLPLFNEGQRKKKLVHAVDSINDKYGEFTVERGTLIEPTTGHGVISPAWRPCGVKRVEY